MAEFTGDSGDNLFVGPNEQNIFFMDQGGEDTVTGGTDRDDVYMGAGLDAGDRLDGGHGGDIVYLSGDYSTGLTITAKMLTGFEQIELSGDFDFDFTIQDAVVDAGGDLAVMGDGIGAENHWSLDGAHVRHGMLSAYVGAARADIVLGQADDEVVAHGAFNTADHLDGGKGEDMLILGAGATDVAFGSTTLKRIERIVLQDHADFHLVMADGNLAFGHSMRISGGLADRMSVDASAETNGRYELDGVDGADALTGGAKADTLGGGGGGDTLTGGAGADRLSGGAGADLFVYGAVGDSGRQAADVISDLDGSDLIDLAAIDADATKAKNQAFHLVDHFTGAAGELIVRYSAKHEVTLVQGDVDGDGLADLSITLTGDHSGFAGLVL